MRPGWLRRMLFLVYRYLERVLAPGLEFAPNRYEAFLARTVAQGCRWLDVGCGHQLLPSWRRGGEQALVRKAALMVGVDPEVGALRMHTAISDRVAGDAAFLPFGDGTFDLVTANWVVEHLASPLDQFREVHRVLRLGGRFVFNTPNRRGHFVAIARMMPERLKAIGVRLLDGRVEDDRFRTFYRANSKPEISRLAEVSGFRVVNVEFVPTAAVFALVPPLAVFELLWIRLTMDWLHELRTAMIVTLERQ